MPVSSLSELVTVYNPKITLVLVDILTLVRTKLLGLMVKTYYKQVSCFLVAKSN